MQDKITEIETQLRYFEEKEVSINSKLFKEKISKLKDIIKINDELKLLKLKSYIADNVEFIYNSKKCHHFINILFENGCCVFMSYSDITRTVGKRMNKMLWGCQLFVGYMESQDIIKVSEFGFGKCKKCLIYINPIIIDKVK